MANSLELGPGIKLLAPSKSRNFSRESHFLRRTSSSSMMAMCAAGPPNAVVPSRRKNSASSLSGVAPEVSLSAKAGCAGSSIRRRFLPEKSRVERAGARASQQQEDQSHQHGKIGARFRLHGPEAALEQNRNFGRRDGRGDYGQERNRSQAGP